MAVHRGETGASDAEACAHVEAARALREKNERAEAAVRFGHAFPSLARAPGVREGRWDPAALEQWHLAREACTDGERAAATLLLSLWERSGRFHLAWAEAEDGWAEGDWAAFRAWLRSPFWLAQGVRPRVHLGRLVARETDAEEGERDVRPIEFGKLEVGRLYAVRGAPGLNGRVVTYYRFWLGDGREARFNVGPEVKAMVARSEGLRWARAELGDAGQKPPAP